MATITQNRRDRYTRLAHDDSGWVVRVYTPDRSRVGFVIGWGPDYSGEAGFSRRLRVLWDDGHTTLCSIRGMIPAHEEPLVLGGFLEWTIR